MPDTDVNPRLWYESASFGKHERDDEWNDFAKDLATFLDKLCKKTCEWVGYMRKNHRRWESAAEALVGESKERVESDVCETPEVACFEWNPFDEEHVRNEAKACWVKGLLISYAAARAYDALCKAYLAWCTVFNFCKSVDLAPTRTPSGRVPEYNTALFKHVGYELLKLRWIARYFRHTGCSNEDLKRTVANERLRVVVAAEKDGTLWNCFNCKTVLREKFSTVVEDSQAAERFRNSDWTVRDCLNAVVAYLNRDATRCDTSVQNELADVILDAFGDKLTRCLTETEADDETFCTKVSTGTGDKGVVSRHFVCYGSLFLQQIESKRRAEKVRNNAHYSGHPDWKALTADEREFFERYMRKLGEFLKLWTLRWLRTFKDALQEKASKRLLRIVLTRFETYWLSYSAKNVYADRKIAASAGQLRQMNHVRPWEMVETRNSASSTLSDMFYEHRIDPAWRGWSDWLRMLVSLQAFGCEFQNLFDDNSDYVLDGCALATNGAWFDPASDHAFLYQVNGRYRFCHSGVAYYANAIPSCLKSALLRRQEFVRELREGLETPSVLNDLFRGFRTEVTENARDDVCCWMGPDVVRLAEDCLTYVEETRSQRSSDEPTDSDEMEDADESDENEIRRLFSLLHETRNQALDRAFPRIGWDDADEAYETASLWAITSMLRRTTTHAQMQTKLLKSIKNAAHHYVDGERHAHISSGSSSNLDTRSDVCAVKELLELTERYENKYF